MIKRQEKKNNTGTLAFFLNGAEKKNKSEEQIIMFCTDEAIKLHNAKGDEWVFCKKWERIWTISSKNGNRSNLHIVWIKENPIINNYWIDKFFKTFDWLSPIKTIHSILQVMSNWCHSHLFFLSSLQKLRTFAKFDHRRT